MMSKLTDFYTHKASLLEKGEPIDPQWELLEDKLLKEELLPELIEQLKVVLLKVKSPLMFCGSYDPNGCLSVSQLLKMCVSVLICLNHRRLLWQRTYESTTACPLPSVSICFSLRKEKEE